jgi:hypothetical protein
VRCVGSRNAIASLTLCLSLSLSRASHSFTHTRTHAPAQLRRLGKNVISLSVGEPDVPTPQVVIDACKAALDNGDTRYTDISGMLELRQAICDDLRRKHPALDYAPDQVLCSCEERGRFGGAHSHVLQVAPSRVCTKSYSPCADRRTR